MKNKLSKLLIVATFMGILAGCSKEAPVSGPEQPAPAIESEPAQIVSDVVGTYTNDLVISRGISLGQLAALSNIEEPEKELIVRTFQSAADYPVSYVYYFSEDGFLYMFADPELDKEMNAAFTESVDSALQATAAEMDIEVTDELVAQVNGLIEANPLPLGSYRGSYTVDPDGKVVTDIFNGYFVASSDGSVAFVPGEDPTALKVADKAYSYLGLSTQNLILFSTYKDGSMLVDQLSGGYTLGDETRIPAPKDNFVVGINFETDDGRTLYGRPGDTWWFGFSDPIEGGVWYADKYDHETDAPYEIVSSDGYYIVIAYGDTPFDDGKITVGGITLNIATEG